MQKRKLLITKDGFYLEGKPLRILSGAIHYFRVPRAYWEDRLVKLRAYGFNTVETYIPWTLHEPQEGVFEWEGEKDFAASALLAEAGAARALAPESLYLRGMGNGRIALVAAEKAGASSALYESPISGGGRPLFR